MSELKAFDITVAEEGYCEGIVKYRRAVYDKSEADKVIAELKHSLDLATDECCSISERAVKQLRHQKYKRCLANAEICCEKKYNCYNRALRKYNKNEADYLVRKSNFWQDCEFLWLKIAEKFKPNKE